MRIAIDTDTRQVRSLLWDANSAWDSYHLARVSFTRRDKFPVEVRFVSSAPPGKPGSFLSRYGWLAFTELPAGDSGRLYLKRASGFAESPLAAASYWSKALGAGGIPTYSFYLNLDTVEMAAAFATEPASIPLVLEIEWSYPLADIEARQTISPPISLKVLNDYIRDTDDTPAPALDLRVKATQSEAEAGIDNDRWMTPLRTAQAIAAQASKIHVSPEPPAIPLVNGSLWIDSDTYRAHVLQEGVWAEITTS